MKTLVIDNIDSFVYNLVQYIGEAGGNPVVVEKTISDEDLLKLAKDCDAIVLSPGPGKPADAGATNAAIRLFAGKKPILGVCLGHQAIFEHYGGVVTYAPELVHGRASEIKHDDSALFKGVKNPFLGGRYHSLSADEKTMPSELIISARGVRGNEIMAIRHKEFPVYGVQFHPESILTEDGMKIIKNFLKEAKK